MAGCPMKPTRNTAMQFSREQGPVNAISRYDASTVWVMGEPHHGSIAICADTLVDDWQCSSIEKLDTETLQPLLALNPEVIVLGVGDRVQFPDAAVMREVMHAGVGIEVMNDGAAVRTYNVMLGESRDVVLGLIRG